MILLWGLLEDETFRSVYEWLKKLKADVFFLNDIDIGQTDISFGNQPYPAYQIYYKQQTYLLNNFKAAYLRPYPFQRHAAFSREPEKASTHSIMLHHYLQSWAENSPGRIISRPSAESTNHSKLFQAMTIRACGFCVPDSLISNDRDEILDFHALYSRIIYKSMSCVRSIVKEFSPDSLGEAPEIGPVMFQQFIAGKNIRVHVAGNRCYAHLIQSESIDYRYAPSVIRSIDIPETVARQCVGITKRLGLVLSGIDLMVTDDEKWYCLEVNPNPGFSCYDSSAEKDIAHAVASILAGEDRGL